MTSAEPCCNGNCNAPSRIMLVMDEDDTDDSCLVAHFCSFECLQEWAFRERDKMPKLSKSRTS